MAGRIHQRSQRLPNGFKGIWFRITGKYQKLPSITSARPQACHLRDRDELQSLIERQLAQRQNLQEEIRPVLEKHKQKLQDLKQDIARYVEMGAEPPTIASGAIQSAPPRARHRLHAGTLAEIFLD
jgi:hypothetical protein